MDISLNFGFTGNECAKIIIQAGIREVVYVTSDEHNNNTDVSSIRAAHKLFDLAGVHIRKHAPEKDHIELHFETKTIVSNDDEAKGNSCINDEEASGKVCSNSNATVPDQEPKNISFPQNEINSVDLKLKNAILILEKEANYKVSFSEPTTRKRQSYLSWDDYFICIAYLSAQRSKDPNTQVGACIVNSMKRIAGVGYNGMPTGCSDDILPWNRVSTSNNGEGEETKYLYVCHAEANAILNKGAADIQGSTIYVDLFPCNECAKLIIQAGIKEVVYLRDTYHDDERCRASRIMFQMSGVTFRQHRPAVKQVLLDLGRGESSLCRVE